MPSPNYLNLPDLIRRPGFGTSGSPGTYGTSGRNIRVRTNFYEITHLPQKNVFHYDITITPDLPPSMNRKVWKCFEDQFLDTVLGGIRPVYDGRKNIFSPKMLQFGDGDGESFEVSICPLLMILHK